MRVLCVLLLGLSAAQAVPFFPRELVGPEPLYVPAVDDPVPYENYEVPPGQAFHFAFQMPQLDLSQIFKPLRLFAGVNLPAVLQQAEEEQRECDSGKFDLTKEESELVTACQEKDVGSLLNAKSELKKCIVAGLPDTSVELREFLNREEFALVSLSSAYSVSFVDGDFDQKRSVTFHLCPKDELNSIDGEIPTPVVSEDRIDTLLSEAEALAPEDAMPAVTSLIPVAAEPEPETPSRPLFQFGFPQLQLPDFGELFEPLFNLVHGGASDPEPEGAMEGAVEGAQSEAHIPGGFLSDLFSIFQPPVRPDVDVHDCANKRFTVSPTVYEVATECKHADDYKECLSESLAEDEEHVEFLGFTTDPDWEVVGSSFTRSTLTLAHETTTKNTIYVKRCRRIEIETEAPATAETSDEEAEASSSEGQESESVEVLPEENPKDSVEQPIEQKIEQKVEEEELSGETGGVEERIPTLPETPEEQQPEEQAPEKQAPEEQAPEEQAPEEQAPEEQAPEEQAPEEQTPEEQAPEEQAPEEQAPEEQAPEEQAPEEQAPEEQAPEEQTPEEQAPEEQAPDEKAPGNQAPEGALVDEDSKAAAEEEEVSSQTTGDDVEVLPADAGDDRYGDATAVVEPLKAEQPIDEDVDAAP